jgi:DNA-binding transcriptional ArsR family regulator
VLAELAIECGTPAADMTALASLARVAALVGNCSRATMLNALMDGQSLSATELAVRAQISRSAASEHLASLVQARLLAVTKTSRFRYYRIGSPIVAAMLESMWLVAAIEIPPHYQYQSASLRALSRARICYDHLGGQVGVGIADTLIARNHAVLTPEGGVLTDAGAEFLSAFGVNVVASRGAWCSVGHVSIGRSAAITLQGTSARKSFADVLNVAS